MHTKLHCYAESWLIMQFFHLAHSLRPNILKFHLYSFYWEKETEKFIVFLEYVWGEHQVL